MTGVALHAEPGADAAEVRWVAPDTPLPAAGEAVRVPDDLGSLLADGTLTEVRVQADGVLTRAAAPVDWRRIGPVVRRAVAAALTVPAQWETRAADPSAADLSLASVTRELLAGEVGDYVRSHGGAIEVVGARDGVVAVRLRGACHGCPASTLTLRHHLEQRLREVCPGLVSVVER